MDDVITFEESCTTKALDIASLVIKKQQDYGPRNILDFGQFGILVRLSDKIQRLRNLIGKKTPVNEAEVDSWRDIAGYAIIALMLHDGTFESPFRLNKE